MTLTFPDSLNVMQPHLAPIAQQGQKDTFLIVLEMFIQQYESFDRDIDLALSSSNGPELHILIHTLKGTATALGLHRLHQITTELDLQLTQRVDLENINVTQLLKFTKLAVLDCRAVLSLNTSNADRTELDTDHDLTTLLKQLQIKLENHEHIQPKFIDMLKSVLSEQQNARYEHVLNLIEQFEYQAAQESLTRLENSS